MKEPLAEPKTETFIVSDRAQLRALNDPLRLAVLREFAHVPRTTKQVATAMNIRSNKLYHHVDALMKAGLLRLIETRPKRGTTEKYLQAVARRFQVDPSVLSPEEACESGLPSALMVRGVGKLSEGQVMELLKRLEAAVAEVAKCAPADAKTYEISCSISRLDSAD